MKLSYRAMCPRWTVANSLSSCINYSVVKILYSPILLDKLNQSPENSLFVVVVKFGLSFLKRFFQIILRKSIH